MGGGSSALNAPLSVCLSVCLSSEVVHGYPANSARRFPRATTSLCPISIDVKMPLLPYLEVSVGFLGVICRVDSRHPVGEDTVTEECAESHRSENDKLEKNLTNMPEDHRMQSLDVIAQRVEIPRCVRQVLCRWTKSSVPRVREPCCFTPLRWSRDVDEFLRVIREVLWNSSISGAEHFCVPRPCAADVTSRFRNNKRQHINACTDNSVTLFFTCSSTVDTA